MTEPGLSQLELNQLPVRSLAYIGDAVYELHVRVGMLKGGERVQGRTGAHVPLGGQHDGPGEVAVAGGLELDPHHRSFMLPASALALRLSCRLLNTSAEPPE